MICKKLPTWTRRRPSSACPSSLLPVSRQNLSITVDHNRYTETISWTITLTPFSDTPIFVTDISPANVLSQTRIAGGLCQVDPDWGTSENSLFTSCLVGDNCIIHVQQCNPRKILVLWTNLQNPQRELFFPITLKKKTVLGPPPPWLVQKTKRPTFPADLGVSISAKAWCHLQVCLLTREISSTQPRQCSTLAAHLARLQEVFNVSKEIYLAPRIGVLLKTPFPHFLLDFLINVFQLPVVLGQSIFSQMC